MKKIRITLICSGKEEFPGCAELLDACPEFRIVSRLAGVKANGAWYALTHSDIVLIDESAVIQAGGAAMRRLHEQFPFIKSLLVLEKSSRNKTMEALSMGVAGVMERMELVNSIRKAIPLLMAGETWVSRGMVRSLHTQLRFTGDESFFSAPSARHETDRKLN